jgi:hypothetical protein
MLKIVIFIFFGILSNTVYGWDGTTSGKINSIQVTSGNNYGFRVTLSGSPTLCGNNHKWAYVNESDSNYAVYVSSLLAAKAAQQTVTLYTYRKDSEIDGYCHIGHIQIN